MSSGGLSPQDIERRALDFRSSELQTKIMRFFEYGQPSGIVAEFRPDKNYFLTAIDYMVFIPRVGMESTVISLGYSPSTAAMGQIGSSGSTIIELINGINLFEFKSFTNFYPNGFILERGRPVYILASAPLLLNPRTGTPYDVLVQGNFNLLLLPTYER